MLTRLADFLRPALEEEAPHESLERDILSSVLNALWVGMLVFTVVVVAGILAWGIELRRLIVPPLLALLIQGARLLLKRGWVRTGSWLLVGGFWGVLTLSVILNNGILTPAAAAYVLPILLGRFLLGLRPTIVLIALSIGVGSLTAYLATQGQMPVPPSAELIQPFWGILVVLLIFVTLLADLSTQLFQKALRRSQAEVAERRRVEEQQRFLAEVGRVLGQSIDYEMTLATVAHLAVPFLADWCIVDITGGDGNLSAVAIAPPDASRVKLASEVLRHYPMEAQRSALLLETLEAGQPALVEHLSPAMLESVALDLTHLNLIQEMAPTSYMMVPLVARGHVLGALSFLMSSPERHYTTDDMALAKELADRCALAVDNARLYADARMREEQIRADQERLQHLSRKLIEAQEQERRLIARELHDEVGQTLTAAKLNMEVLQGDDLPASAQPWVRESITMLEKTLQQLRTLCLELRPSLLDDLGLHSALHWYLMRQAERNHWSASLLMEPPSLSPPPQIETTCFRIVQEALTNTARHARAKQVAVELYLEEGILHLTIKDDGIGFDVQAAHTMALQGGSIGLLGMEERALLVGGELHFVSEPGQGAVIRASLPVHTLDPG